MGHSGAFCAAWFPKGAGKRENPPFPPPGGLPSPSRHIYNGLTIAVAFRRRSAFDGVWQLLIKVDGTFA
jgi:hypothetical protein